MSSWQNYFHRIDIYLLRSQFSSFVDESNKKSWLSYLIALISHLWYEWVFLIIIDLRSTRLGPSVNALIYDGGDEKAHSEAGVT